MDKAILKTEDIHALLSWRDAHQDLVRSMPSPLKAIEILCPDTRYTIKGIRDSGKVSLYLSHSGKPVCKLQFDVAQTDGKSCLVRKSMTGEQLQQDDINSVVTVYCSLMALMTYGCENMPSNAERKKRPAGHPQTPTGAAGKPAGRSVPSVTYIMKMRGHSPTLTPCGSHTSPNGIFSVRGHYRHYKNGVTIWIGEYKKGLGDRKNKIYKTGL